LNEEGDHQKRRVHKKEGNLYFNAVDDCDSSMTTAADTVIAIIEDPLFSILKKNPNKTCPTG
jgi:acyl CoA:acetate/3-ketoacid CoA transferase alpha subunit